MARAIVVKKASRQVPARPKRSAGGKATPTSVTTAKAARATSKVSKADKTTHAGTAVQTAKSATPAKSTKSAEPARSAQSANSVKSTKPARCGTEQAVLEHLPAAMTGRASPAKAKEGDEPVFAYIRSLPQPQRGIAERVDALAASTLPALKRSVKWGIAWYGLGDGWCFCCGGFAGHVKLTFGRGTSLDPVPPMTPIGMGKDSRGVEIASLDRFDERQAAVWMKQATALPGFGGKKR